MIARKMPRVPILLPDGRFYESAHACARGIGVHPTTVFTHLRKGTLHRLGLGQGAKRPTYVSSFEKQAKPFTFLGKTYKNRKAAAQALGIPYDKFKHATGPRAGLRAKQALIAEIESRQRKKIENVDLENAPRMATGSFHAQGRIKPTRPCTHCGKPNDYGRFLCYNCFTSVV